MVFNPLLRPGVKSERWGQVRQMRRRSGTQGDQHPIDREVLAEGGQRRGAGEKTLRH